MPIAFFWLMIFLTAPVGFPVGIGVGTATSALSAKFGITYQAFWDLVPMWLALAVAGYFQWFVIVPSLWRVFRPAKSSNSSFEKGRRKSAAPLN